MGVRFLRWAALANDFSGEVLTPRFYQLRLFSGATLHVEIAPFLRREVSTIEKALDEIGRPNWTQRTAHR
jgi:hypothetical protein